MKVTPEKNAQIGKLTFGSIYPLYLEKVTKKGRTKEELNKVIEWLTGYNSTKIHELSQTNISFKTFFENATIHPNASLIKGVICGYRIEDIEDEFQIYRQVRYLDKLVDELAKGKKMEKILRT
jgi:hypothetical protein